MVLIKIFIAFYLTIGIFYAVYVVFVGAAKWSDMPINILGGPLVLIINYFRAKKGRLGPGL